MGFFQPSYDTIMRSFLKMVDALESLRKKHLQEAAKLEDQYYKEQERHNKLVATIQDKKTCEQIAAAKCSKTADNIRKIME